MPFSTLLFDLDGTLLDTLSDLCNSVNYALRQHALPPRSRQEIRAFLGNGIHNLIERSVPAQTPSLLLEEVFCTFRNHYVQHSLDTTLPYPGILPLLAELRQRNVQMGIVSNKLDPAVQDLNRRFFADFMQIAVGESAGMRRKPHPDIVWKAMRQLQARPDETLYVGDSEVDFHTARAALLPCALVTWGFRDEPELRTLGADYYISAPADLFPLVG